MLGREPRMPIDLMFELPNTHAYNHGEDISNLEEKLQKAHIAREKLKQSCIRQQENYDLHVHHFMYKPGDKVWYLRKEFSNTYNGPYIISKKLSDLTYQLRIKDEEGEDNIKSYTMTN